MRVGDCVLQAVELGGTGNRIVLGRPAAEAPWVQAARSHSVSPSVIHSASALPMAAEWVMPICTPVAW